MGAGVYPLGYQGLLLANPTCSEQGYRGEYVDV